MSDTTWGSWSLNYDRTYLVHEGGYSVALFDIDAERNIGWWAEHLFGKGWGTEEVVSDFIAAANEMLYGILL